MHAIKPVPRNAHGRLDEEEEEEAVIHKKEIGNEADSMDESSWVGRKVDALFSPVLNFLNQHESPCAGEDEKQEEDTHPATSSSTSSSSAPQYFVDDSDDDDMSLQAVEQPADAEEFNPWQFIKTLPAYQHVSHLRPKITLPAKDRQAPPVTLVLDLDETLVHCTVEEVENPNFTFPVNFHGVTYTVHVRLRPNLYRFLESCRGKFEVIVFTASQEVYANELLNLIDPGTFQLCVCWWKRWFTHFCYLVQRGNTFSIAFTANLVYRWKATSSKTFMFWAVTWPRRSLWTTRHMLSAIRSPMVFQLNLGSTIPMIGNS